jgi:cellulose biosynthesis protein BcsQ
MNTYVFANQKGGVGKTMISLGVATATAEGGARVCYSTSTRARR